MWTPINLVTKNLVTQLDFKNDSLNIWHCVNDHWSETAKVIHFNLKIKFLISTFLLCKSIEKEQPKKDGTASFTLTITA